MNQEFEMRLAQAKLELTRRISGRDEYVLADVIYSLSVKHRVNPGYLYQYHRKHHEVQELSIVKG